MALPHSRHESIRGDDHERAPHMTLLPPLSDEQREEIERFRREDEDRRMRLEASLAAAEMATAEALAALQQAKREVRFPLESVRIEINDT